MINKRKKSVRYRGSKTHGCGSMKKRRGKGNKGGSGRAGTGKRADQKKPSVWKEKTGNVGFTPHNVKLKIKSINTAKVQKLISSGLLKEEKGIYDLGKLGYNKLLGKGQIVKGVKIKVLKSSKKVVEAVKKDGGEIILEVIEQTTKE